MSDNLSWWILCMCISTNIGVWILVGMHLVGE